MGDIYNISLANVSHLTAISSIEKYYCPRKQYFMNETLQIKEGESLVLSNKWNISYQDMTGFNWQGCQDSHSSAK